MGSGVSAGVERGEAAMSTRDARALVRAAARALSSRDVKQARVILNGLLKTWRPRGERVTPRQKAKRLSHGYQVRQHARMVRKLYRDSLLIKQWRNTP